MAEPKPCLRLACIPSDCHTVLPGGVERRERVVFLKSSRLQIALISRCQVSQFPCLPCRHQQSCYSPVFWCTEEGLERETERRGGTSPHTKDSAYPLGTSRPPPKTENLQSNVTKVTFSQLSVLLTQDRQACFLNI